MSDNLLTYDANSTQQYIRTTDTGGVHVPHYNLESFPAAQLSAFGTLEMGELTPVFQTDFIHGINSQTGVATASATAGATATTNNGRLALTCGTNVAGSATYRSRRPLKYRPGQGMMARFTPVYAAPVANHRQLFGPGNEDDGYLVGFEGTAFGIRHRNNAASDTWIAQADFNGDTCDGLGASGFDWSPENGFGVPVMIKWPFLGFGNITFFVQNPATSAWILFHTIRYANTSGVIQLSNPNVFFWVENINTGNTTSKTIYCGSVGCFLSGARSFYSGPKWATDNSKTGISTTETVLFSVRNATTYNGVTNRSLIRLQSLSVGAVSSSTDRRVTVRLRVGASVGGTPSFTPISGSTADEGVTITSGNSVGSFDIAGTTASGGNLIYNIALVATGNEVINLTDFDLFFAPGETLTVSAVANDTTAVVAALNWAEDV